jgi:hypothetical protein
MSYSLEVWSDELRLAAMHVIGHHRNPVIRHVRERNTGSVARARCRPVAATRAGHAVQLGLDLAAFERDRHGKAVLERVQRGVDSWLPDAEAMTRVPSRVMACTLPSA